MKMYLDCYPCVLRHALDVARLTTPHEHVQYAVLQRAVEELANVPPESTPPEITARMHRFIKNVTGNPDPYRQIKQTHNAIALGFYPKLKATIEASRSPLLTATKLAIAGNIIDSGASGGEFDLKATIEETLRTDVVGGPFDEFEKELEGAAHILYLGDNAGEIVFDKLLIEEIRKRSQVAFTFAVKGEPILNDATIEDARSVGIDAVAEVITNGYDAPATLLDKSSERLRRAWESTDLVIAKGQGNYESLSEEKGNIFFLLKVKCAVLARDIGRRVGESVLTRGKGRHVQRGGVGTLQK